MYCHEIADVAESARIDDDHGKTATGLVLLSYLMVNPLEGKI
jgi:hypothetical protein